MGGWVGGWVGGNNRDASLECLPYGPMFASN